MSTKKRISDDICHRYVHTCMNRGYLRRIDLKRKLCSYCAFYSQDYFVYGVKEPLCPYQMGIMHSWKIAKSLQNRSNSAAFALTVNLLH